MDDALTVGEVAHLVGVSVRTLHHYESLGLLEPARTPKGYRVYSALDIDRLHTILVYRSLEFPLEKIQTLLDGGATPLAELRRQRDLLEEKKAHLQSVLDSVQTMIEVHTMNKKLTAAERAQASHARYAEEAEARYGSTDAYRQSSARTAAFTNEDWARVTAVTENFEADCAEALAEGVGADSERANKLAETHRELMNAYFDCSYEQQVLIAKTYVTDERFTAHYDERAKGLAQWIHDAVVANAQSHGVDVSTAEWK